MSRRLFNRTGRRSKFEARIEKEYFRGKVAYEYEKYSYNYFVPVARTFCGECGSKDILTSRWYTPDYFISNGVIIELKGKLDAKERKKLLAVREDNDDLKDLKLVFMRDNKIHKSSTTRYSKWAVDRDWETACPSVL